MFDAPVTIAHAIQLAVAPVFLLTAIGAMLAVFSGRLARIIDRGRRLQEQFVADPDERRAMHEEMSMLARRARLIHRAIGLCTGSALFVAGVIAVIFLGFFVTLKMAVVVASLFVASTLAFMLALLHFLREVHLASYSLRLGPREPEPASAGPAAVVPLQGRRG